MSDPTIGSGLDQPGSTRRSVKPAYDPESWGKLSERIARFIGSWRFITWMTVFVVVWITWNIAAPESLRFDPWPFLVLILMLSLQASYAAPLILLAQNRQTDRDRVTLEQDRARTDQVLSDIDFTAREIAAMRSQMDDVATRDFIKDELRDVLDEYVKRENIEQTP